MGVKFLVCFSLSHPPMVLNYFMMWDAKLFQHCDIVNSHLLVIIFITDAYIYMHNAYTHTHTLKSIGIGFIFFFFNIFKGSTFGVVKMQQTET